MPADELVLKLSNLGHELLGDWLVRPVIRAAWQPVDLDWFPDVRLKSIAKAANEGVDPDMLPLALSRNGSAALWPHPEDAVDLLIKIPSRGRGFEQQILEIRETYTKRKIREVLQSNAGKVETKALDDIVREIESFRPVETLPALPVVNIDELFEPLGPEPWLCEALALQPGAPWMLSGNSGRGKSWLLTDLALAIASGQLFGGLGVRQGIVRWIHLEGSRRDLMKRVQHLSAGRQLGPDDLRGQFLASSHPKFNFQDPILERQLVKECTGVAFAVVDTFAVAAAGMNENDSSIRQPLDMLGRVSEATGCAFAVVHHHRKDPQDKTNAVDLEQMTRGSGALANALSASWAITRLKKSNPTSLFRSKLTLGKSWFGERDALIIEAVHSHVVSGAVDLHISRAPTEDKATDDTATRDYTEQDQAILNTVNAHPEGVNFAGLCGTLKLRRGLVSERIEAMRLEGRLDIQLGARGARVIRPAQTGP